jgi:hypothetical protein
MRYANDGLAALGNRSAKPDRCPHQMAPEVEDRIVELRRSHPGWGPRTILNRLRPRARPTAVALRGSIAAWCAIA